jgi:hypothetical protein
MAKKKGRSLCNYFLCCFCYKGYAYIPDQTRFILLPAEGTSINNKGLDEVAKNIHGETCYYFVKSKTYTKTIQNYDLAYFEGDTKETIRLATVENFDVLTVNKSSFFSIGYASLNDAFNALIKKGYQYSQIFGYFCAVGTNNEGDDQAPVNEGYIQMKDVIN